MHFRISDMLPPCLRLTEISRTDLRHIFQLTWIASVMRFWKCMNRSIFQFFIILFLLLFPFFLILIFTVVVSTHNVKITVFNIEITGIVGSCFNKMMLWIRKLNVALTRSANCRSDLLIEIKIINIPLCSSIKLSCNFSNRRIIALFQPHSRHD